jgi:hypothetical protein
MDLGTGCSKGLSLVVGSGKARYLVPGSDQFFHDRRPDEACGSGNKNTHEVLLWFVW